MLTTKGLRFDPQPGDIVSVRVVGKTNPDHYRETALWRVEAANAGTVRVRCLTAKRGVEIWPRQGHEFFEASDLAEGEG